MFEDLFNRGGLSLGRLHALIQLGEEGSLIRAAKGDPGLQSRYSHDIKELSAFFGVALTDRIGKTIRLTEAGQRLVRLAREQFQALTQFKRDSERSPMRFRVGAAGSLLQWLAVPAVTLLRRPGVDLRFALQNLRADDVVARLQDQRLEFGIVPTSTPLHGLRAKSICQVNHIIVVPDRISARRGMLTLEQAFDCPHAALPNTSPVRQAIDQIVRDLPGRFDPHLECDSESQCAAAVQSGYFAGVLPLWAWTTDTALPHSICEDPRLDRLHQKLALVWHPRLVETRGAPADEVRKNLAAKLSEVGAISSRRH